jgi:hypothetical protein
LIIKKQNLSADNGSTADSFISFKSVSYVLWYKSQGYGSQLPILVEIDHRQQCAVCKIVLEHLPLPYYPVHALRGHIWQIDQDLPSMQAYYQYGTS